MIGAMTVSGALASTCIASGMATPEQAMEYVILGTLGGLLPDVDSDNSVPIRIAFLLCSVWAGFFAAFQLCKHIPVSEALMLGVAVFVAIRFGVFYLFTECTVHRGVWHSLPAAALAGLATTNMGVWLFDVRVTTAWTQGLFVATGYVVHLVLDELFAVNMLGMQVKRSFGSATKLFSFAAPWPSVMLYAVLLGALMMAPSIRPLVHMCRVLARTWHLYPS